MSDSENKFNLFYKYNPTKNEIEKKLEPMVFDEIKFEDIKLDEIADDERFVACISANDLDEYKEIFGGDDRVIDSCNKIIDSCKDKEKVKSFRSKIDVHDSYIFTDLTVIDLYDDNEKFNIDGIMNSIGTEEDQKKDNEIKDIFALCISKNFLVLVYINDENGSSFEKFKSAISDLKPKEIDIDTNNTFERLIYLFFLKLTERDNELIETLDTKITAMEKSIIKGDVNEQFSEDVLRLKILLSSLQNYYEQILDITAVLNDNSSRFLTNSEKPAYIRRITRIVQRLRDDIGNMRNDANHLQDAYKSYIDTEMNKTMNKFTVISFMFLPLTFLTGFFGMNFTIEKYGSHINNVLTALFGEKIMSSIFKGGFEQAFMNNGFSWTFIASVLVIGILGIVAYKKRWWKK